MKEIEITVFNLVPFDFLTTPEELKQVVLRANICLMQNKLNCFVTEHDLDTEQKIGFNFLYPEIQHWESVTLRSKSYKLLTVKLVTELKMDNVEDICTDSIVIHRRVNDDSGIIPLLKLYHSMYEELDAKLYEVPDIASDVNGVLCADGLFESVTTTNVVEFMVDLVKSNVSINKLIVNPSKLNLIKH